MKDWIGLIIVVLFHYLVFFAFILTVLLSWIQLPWYLYLSVVALIARVIFSRNICPLTLLENVFRLRLDLDKSTGFLKDWIIAPMKAILRIK
jgi:hypothetical protein